MIRTTLKLLLVAMFFSSACGPDIDDKGGVPRFYNTLESAEQFGALAADDTVKYLINLTPGTVPLYDVCYFVNTAQFPLHYDFLRSFGPYENLAFATYSAWVLAPTERRFYGGILKSWPNVLHPKTKTQGFTGFGVYSLNTGMTIGDLEYAYAQLRTCAPFTEDRFVFVPDGTDQRRWLRENTDALDERNISYIFPDALGSSPTIHSAGESYGTLVVVPPGERLRDYGPLDIVVVESPPADVSLMQGLLTSDLQNELSHTNLRLLEKKIPNASIPNLYALPEIETYDGKLIHLVANDDSVTISPATIEDAEAFWNRQRPTLPPIESDLTVSELGTFESIRNVDAQAYGAKAANLGELFSILPNVNRTPGFGIPFSAYADHVTNNDIDIQISAFLDDPRSTSDVTFKREGLKSIRDAIKDAAISVDLLGRIEQQSSSVFGTASQTTRLRFRSSTNVEDLDALTGAGLYDSKSGCLADDGDGDRIGPSACLTTAEADDKNERLTQVRGDLKDDPTNAYLIDLIDDLEGDLSEEKTVERAVKKVWASLWNERAFDERNYYRIDHRKAFMGIAVNPSFVLEQVNAVALTELQPDDGRPLYRINSQVGHESVVRPDNPNATAELLTFRRALERPFAEDVEVLVRSSEASGDLLWSDDQLAELSGILYNAHVHFATNVYPHLDLFSLDVEVKLTAEGRIVLKQARPFIAF